MPPTDMAITTLLNYNRRSHTNYTRDAPGAPGTGAQGDYATGPHGTPTT